MIINKFVFPCIEGEGEAVFEVNITDVNDVDKWEVIHCENVDPIPGNTPLDKFKSKLQDCRLMAEALGEVTDETLFTNGYKLKREDGKIKIVSSLES